MNYSFIDTTPHIESDIQELKNIRKYREEVNTIFKFSQKKTRIPHGTGIQDHIIPTYLESSPRANNIQMRSMRWQQQRTRAPPKQGWQNTHDLYNIQDTREYKECQCSKSNNKSPELLRIFCDIHN